ncbi:LysR family transcriptional regulator [Sphaerisporangium rufum]|uniref:LysR family transcriptional regulator n=2 Tax=Sphaerisporangium rufum TaxID=1381558 RepID=A0A919V3M7_9ACTN|nr:LysR family transcriptional regulator [Sphaerisporangium rufum]
MRQLEYFVAVAEERSFTRAAARLHVSQPGISAQIRRLERELGQELLDRSARGTGLTKVGAAVLPYARAALEAAAGARLAVDEMTGLLRGQVAIGTIPSCPALDLPGLLAGFHKAHPAVEVTLREATSAALVDDLRAGLLDLAFAALTPATPAGLSTHDVTDERVVAAVAPDGPLAGVTTITVAGLRDQALISLPPGTGLRWCLEEACAAAGFRPRVAFEAGDPEMVARLAGQGLGVAVLPESVAAAHAGELRPIVVTGPEMRGRIALTWRSEGPITPAARALLQLAVLTLRAPRAGSGAL